MSPDNRILSLRQPVPSTENGSRSSCHVVGAMPPWGAHILILHLITHRIRTVFFLYETTASIRRISFGDPSTSLDTRGPRMARKDGDAARNNSHPAESDTHPPTAQPDAYTFESPDAVTVETDRVRQEGRSLSLSPSAMDLRRMNNRCIMTLRCSRQPVTNPQTSNRQTSIPGSAIP